MSYLAERTIEGLPPMANQMLRGDWRRRYAYAKKWKLLTCLAFGPDRPALPLEKAKITLTRVSSRRPDWDGLTSGFKHVIDGLVDCRVLKDDNFDVIGQPTYHWELCKPSQGYIVIRVEEI